MRRQRVLRQPRRRWFAEALTWDLPPADLALYAGYHSKPPGTSTFLLEVNARIAPEVRERVAGPPHARLQGPRACGRGLPSGKASLMVISAAIVSGVSNP